MSPYWSYKPEMPVDQPLEFDLTQATWRRCASEARRTSCGWYKVSKAPGIRCFTSHVTDVFVPPDQCFLLQVP